MVATLDSLGAALDIAHVRHVFILAVPDSPEKLWQAGGRAGRDGEIAMVHLFSSLRDYCYALARCPLEQAPLMRVVVRCFGASSSGCHIQGLLCHLDGRCSAMCGHCGFCRHLEKYELCTVAGDVQASLMLFDASVDGAPVQLPFNEVERQVSLGIFSLCIEQGALLPVLTASGALVISRACDDATHKKRWLPSSDLLVYIEKHADASKELREPPTAGEGRESTSQAHVTGPQKRKKLAKGPPKS